MDKKATVLLENHKRFGVIPIMFHIPYDFKVEKCAKMINDLIAAHGGTILDKPQSIISHCLVVKINNDYIEDFNGKK